MKSILISFVILVAAISSYADVEKDFDGLGGNKILLEKAKAINPGTEISVVQERTVSRRNRWEIAPEYSGNFGGDAYVKTISAGLNVHYHINPKWSLGVKYNQSFNKLTPEGEALIARALDDYSKNSNNPTAAVPAINYQKEEKMVFADWYPIYGKVNLFDRVAQFDVYGLAGLGTVTLQSGDASSYSLGGGLGIWWTKNFSTRAEMRYQTYKAPFFDGEKSMDLALGSIQMGWIL